MSKKAEQQQNLPGIPEATTFIWRANYQYQGPNYALRAGSLIIPADNIEKARLIANGVLKDQYGDKWFNVTKISNVNPLDEAPF